MRNRVYVIGDPASDGPVKIGTTVNLTTRLADIRAGGVLTPPSVNLRAVEVLYDHPGDRRFEQDLHRHYAASRLVGEWFALGPEVARGIVAGYLAETAEVGTVRARCTECFCYVCRFVYPTDLLPRDREECADPSRALLAAVEAMTHARLGVALSDEHVVLSASHCDIDRALRLIEVQESTRRYATSG